MGSWFAEFLLILSFSRKTQYAIILGVVGHITIIFLGEYQISHFHLSGFLEPLSDIIKNKLRGKFDKAALGFLISCWLMAIKLYRKDKKRFYRMM